MPEDRPSPGDVVFGHVPDWMDGVFFERALGAGLGGDPRLLVRRCEVRPATGKGENYVSVVYAAKVTTGIDAADNEEQQHHLIVKCLPSNKARKLMSNNAEFFRKEVDMYEVVFPEFRRLSSGVAMGAMPWPRHLSSLLDGDRDFIVLEDLRVSGYAMRERLRGLDAGHLASALRALARFHAFSYALKIKEPGVFRSKVQNLFPETMFSRKSEEMLSVFMRNTYRDTAAVVRGWGEVRYSRVADWMDVTVDGVVGDMVRLLSPDDRGAVLNHGDFWINNMLFRDPCDAEEEGGGDVKLLDFQISRVCSPACDLSYLMVTSTTAPVRRDNWEPLLRTTYLHNFWDTLEILGAKDTAEAGVYTWQWLQSELIRYRLFAFVTCLTTTQVVLAEASEAPDMDAMTEEQMTGRDMENPFAALAKGKLYQERFRGLLDEFLDEGVLFQ